MGSCRLDGGERNCFTAHTEADAREVRADQAACGKRGVAGICGVANISQVAGVKEKVGPANWYPESGRFRNAVVQLCDVRSGPGGYGPAR